MGEPATLRWKVDEWSSYSDRIHLRGWCFDLQTPIVEVAVGFESPAIIRRLTSFGLPSEDVAAAVDPRAGKCRFDEWLELPREAVGRDFKLHFTLAGGGVAQGGSVTASASKDDPYFLCWYHFIDLLGGFKSGKVLEIGSRARSALTYRQFMPPGLTYVGMDILPGPNVDVVGDAHEMEKLFGAGEFVAVFSQSVFEHLAMPWKVALELNRVLIPGGLVFTGTHQTWPVHEEPWDFWRFTRYSWRTLFNAMTGFEIVEVACGQPARIQPMHPNAATRGLPEFSAYLGSASIVRKTADTRLSWPLPTELVAEGHYPKGELLVPPS
jgi:hypothetical protein